MEQGTQERPLPILKEKPVSSLHEIYQVLQTRPSHGSGRGVSYWSKAMQCGRLANLLEARQMDLTIEEQLELSTADKVIGKFAGSYFHALQEAWHNGGFSKDTVVSADDFDLNFHEAVRCIRAYQKFWHRGFFGKTLGCEVTFPRTPEEAAWLRELVGEDFTFRVDRLIELTEEEATLININRNADLPGAGRYILDYKLVYSHQFKDAWEYTEGLQALAYPSVYNALHEHFDYGAPVRGMIFDITSRSTKIEANWRIKNFALYLAKPAPDFVELLSNALRQAKRNLVDDSANPFACVGPYGPCTFLKNATCNRR